MLKRLALILMIVLIVGLTAAFSQTKLETGYKYHFEEFIFLNWNNQKPIIFIFQVATGFDGPKMTRDYRGWFSINGRWSLFLDERLDSDHPSDSPLHEVLSVTTDDSGQHHIDFNHENLHFNLAVQEELTAFAADGSSEVRTITTTLHRAALQHNDARLAGLVAHNYQYFKSENPLIPEHNFKQFGPNYDRIYLIDRQGNFIIATQSGSFESQKEAFVWMDNQNNTTISADIVRTVSETDSVVWMDYPVAWQMDLPTEDITAMINGIGSYLQFGAEEDATALAMLSLTTVRGVMTHRQKGEPVVGLVISIRED